MFTPGNVGSETANLPDQSLSVDTASTVSRGFYQWDGSFISFGLHSSDSRTFACS
ncbi:hypothetical protein HanXRQr2_Chr16g0752741 [Helianthus annuus]|nr:hypothetical protein HanXRQr2_Chr16g0752741 [Helianthus annuus]KAJ0821544.1 hypothetical protein HanPSC8_Chr16g0721501 [Helianthus annuus]